MKQSLECLATLVTNMQTRKKKKKKKKSIIKFPLPDLNQGVLIGRPALTVLAVRDNYNIHIGKRALFNVDYGGMSLSHYR